MGCDSQSGSRSACSPHILLFRRPYPLRKCLLSWGKRVTHVPSGSLLLCPESDSSWAVTGLGPTLGPASRRSREMSDCYTELEKAVIVLVENFYKYVSKYSLVKNKISKSSFREMLQKELNHMLSDTGNRKAADKLIQNLDANHDGRISFDEYWTLIGGITGPIAKLIREQEQQSSS
ncbi:protein S100-A16 isoform X1 [Symphalangus syndactylus]|uniref:protein S100-A16 isoform X1 n=1 Tax=Symphalangus syndactylus TaxID=9590 RepID=UPI003004E560